MHVNAAEHRRKAAHVVGLVLNREGDQEKLAEQVQGYARDDELIGHHQVAHDAQGRGHQTKVGSDH